jgi:hypothetical protein
MKAASFLTAVTAAIYMTGCATTGHEAAREEIDYAIAAVDNPAEARFEIVLTSLSNKALCVNDEDWPDHGYIHYGDHFAVALVGDMQYPISDWNMGYCPGGCGYERVEPRSSLVGYLPYERFPAAVAQTSATRSLQFTPNVLFCKRGDKIAKDTVR